MEKIIKTAFLLLTMFVCIFITGCKKDTPTPTPNPKPSDGDNPIIEDEPNYNFMGASFIIMVDSAASSDPRNQSYQKLFQAEKVAAIQRVEAKYNLKIKFQTYPSDASWGGARERFIIQNSAAGTPKAHIYEMPSYSIGTLAVAKAISPLTEYIDKFGEKGYWPSAKLYGTVLNDIYSYSDIYSTVDEGIFYNIDLLKEYLGADKGDLPSQLWLKGEWTWDKYLEICQLLDQSLPEGYYVMGGTAYNWAYQFLGSNGVHIVDSKFNCHLADQASIDAINYLNNIQKTIRWDIDSCSLDNATSTEMVKGKVAFHNGQSYWIYQSNKWLDKNFEIGFVPYPVGPNVKDKENLTDYYINDVYGKTQFCISSSYAKSKVRPGYETSTLHDEIIFKIWNELQVFPEIDPATGYCNAEDYIDEYIVQRVAKYYGNEASVECHRDIIDKGYPDYFYSLDEAKAQTAGSYMLMVQSAVKNEADDIRNSMMNVKSLVESAFMNKYNLPSDYYEKDN